MRAPATLIEAGFKRRIFSGNPHAQNAPYRYGWIIRLGGPVRADEKRWLVAHGYSYSGGKWCRADDRR